MSKKGTSKAIRMYAVDFFCGAGGVTYGFNKAKIKVLGGIDIDINCRDTYEKNNKESKFICADISNYSPEKLIEDLKIKINDDNLIFVGCSPCQYYSIMNTSREKSIKSKLLLDDFRNFVDFFKPGYVFIENVPGIETKLDSPLEKFKTYLTSCNYTFVDGVLNSVDFQVPQNRKRYVLIASRVTDKIEIPKAKDKSKMTVRNFIAKEKGFPEISAGNKDSSKKQNITSGVSAINLRRLRKTPHNGGTRLSWKNDTELQLKCYKGKDKIFYDVYGRLSWDLPASTITTKFYSLSNGRFAHPEQNRALSLREGATLQTFPKKYFFYGSSIAMIARMIGNAVPPNMARILGASILKNRINGKISSQSTSS